MLDRQKEEIEALPKGDKEKLDRRYAYVMDRAKERAAQAGRPMPKHMPDLLLQRVINEIKGDERLDYDKIVAQLGM